MVFDFIQDQHIAITNIPEAQKACPIDFNDSLLELLPEVYLDEKAPSEDENKKRLKILCAIWLHLWLKTTGKQILK
jgi:hypothetical protein